MIWGEKGRKAEHLAVVSSDVSAWLSVCVGRGGYTVAAGDSTVPAIVRKLQIDQIVEARLWAYYLGHVNVSLVSSWFTGPSECMFVCKEPKLEEPKIELLYVCV